MDSLTAYPFLFDDPSPFPDVPPLDVFGVPAAFPPSSSSPHIMQQRNTFASDPAASNAATPASSSRSATPRPLTIRTTNLFNPYEQLAPPSAGLEDIWNNTSPTAAALPSAPVGKTTASVSSSSPPDCCSGLPAYNFPHASPLVSATSLPSLQSPEIASPNFASSTSSLSIDEMSPQQSPHPLTSSKSMPSLPAPGSPTQQQFGDEHQKPDISYAKLIADAIEGSPMGKLTLAEIYVAISTRYPYFKDSDPRWKNSIRHNLTVNAQFVKNVRPHGDNGKGSFWSLDMSAVAIRKPRRFSGGNGFQPYGKRRASNARKVSLTTSLAPSSPNGDDTNHNNNNADIFVGSSSSNTNPFGEQAPSSSSTPTSGTRRRSTKKGAALAAEIGPYDDTYQYQFQHRYPYPYNPVAAYPTSPIAYPPSPTTFTPHFPPIATNVTNACRTLFMAAFYHSSFTALSTRLQSGGSMLPSDALVYEAFRQAIELNKCDNLVASGESNELCPAELVGPLMAMLGGGLRGWVDRCVQDRMVPGEVVGKWDTESFIGSVAALGL